MPDDAPLFAASEVNLLIYHYLKESGFHHACFALRYEARLDDLPMAHEPVVRPHQLLSYLHKGLLFETAEKQAATPGEKAQPPTLLGGTAPASVPELPPAPTPHKDAGVQAHAASLKRRASDDAPVEKRNRAEAPPQTTTHDAAAAPEVARVDTLRGHTGEVFAAAWNPSVLDLLASGAGDATVRIWDLRANSAPVVCRHLPPSQAKNIATLAWNPDGTLLASGSHDGILRVWTPQGDLHLVLSMHQGAVFAVRWNRTGNLLLTGSADGSAIVWDVNSGRTVHQYSLHNESVLDVQWITGDGGAADARDADALFAMCSADGRIHVCRVGEPQPVRTLVGHTDEVNALRVDPSQTLLASVSDDGTARVWSLDGRSDAPVRTLTGHTKELYALAWAPTGPGSGRADEPRMLATTSFDHTARLWNADTGECERVVAEHEDSVYAVCFSPCARYVATGGIDAHVYVTRVAVRGVLTRMGAWFSGTMPVARCSTSRGSATGASRPRRRTVRLPCSMCRERLHNVICNVNCHMNICKVLTHV